MSTSVMNKSNPMEATREQLADAGREIRDRACDASQAVQGKAAELKDAVTEGTAEVWSSVVDAGNDVRNRAVEDFAAARDAAGEYFEEGRVRLEEFGATAERQIRSQPVKSLLIAAGAGFLLGALWSRR